MHKLARSAYHWRWRWPQCARWLSGGLTGCGIWDAVEQEIFNFLVFPPSVPPSDFEYTTFEFQLGLGEASIVFV
jgi:hypothetical protein